LALLTVLHLEYQKALQRESYWVLKMERLKA
jgi:hypothetical protein